MQKAPVLLIGVALFALLLPYGVNAASEDPPAIDAEIKTLAMVNDRPITEYELKQSMKRAPHGEKVSAGTERAALETLIREELIYQTAMELGLDSDPAYSKKLKAAEAQLRTFQREAMSALYRQYAKEKASVTDSEAQAYFDANLQRLRTKFHVWQISYKGEEDRVAKDESDLKAGISFKEVASRRFPKLPENVKEPWDLGYLHWNQIPQAWTDVIYNLELGKPSPILRGDNGRLWIIEVIDKTIDEEITFATEKDRIVEILKRQKTSELYDGMLKKKREASNIVFPK